MNRGTSRAAGQRALPAACLVAGIAAACVLFAFDPASARIYPICPFHALTGLYCPLCGSLRGFHALLHGHPIQAIRCNMLMAGFVMYGVAIFVLRQGMGCEPVSKKSARWLVAAGIVAVFTIVRNLPGAFWWLRP